MARTVQVHLLDDIDGSPADETVRFSLDGTSYEIDLKADHSEELRKTLAKYIVAGRRHGGGIVTSRSRGSRAPIASTRLHSQTIREWAKRSGYDVSDRGRIPANLVELYEKDTNA
jgi:hypothetical protein